MFVRRHLFAGVVSSKSWLKCWKPTESLLGSLSWSVWDIYDKPFKFPSRNYSLFRRKKCSENLRTWTRFNRGGFENADADASLFSLLLLFITQQVGADWLQSIIMTWSPADFGGKVRSPDRDATKQTARNVPLASADVRGEGRYIAQRAQRMSA